jgi:hypothetical protein
MSSGPITPFPIRTPIMEQDGKSVSAIPARWFNSIQQFLNSLLGTTAIGNGANGNIQAPAIGTGSGPLNPNLIAGFRQITINGETWWQPLCK